MLAGDGWSWLAGDGLKEQEVANRESQKMCGRLEEMAHGRGEDASMIKERCVVVCFSYAVFVVATFCTWLLCCRSTPRITGAGRGLALAEALWAQVVASHQGRKLTWRWS